MTYREAIQIQIQALQDIYDHAAALRDVATEEEKNVWNMLRTTLPKLWGPLQDIDNNLGPLRAKYQLKGDYKIDVSTHNI